MQTTQPPHLPRFHPLKIGIPLTLLGLTVFGLVLYADFYAPGTPQERWLPALDVQVAEHFYNANQNESLIRTLMIGFTHLGGIPVQAVLATVLTAWQFARKNYVTAIACAIIPASGALLNYGLKTAIGRERPPLNWRDAFVHETNQSFPSGHAMGGTVGMGMLAYVLSKQMKSRPGRVFLCLATVGLIAGIGFSRIFLRAHWFSDVLAGCAIGGAWLAMGLGIAEMFQRRLKT